MLRDVPRIYRMFLLFGLFMLSMITLYTKTFMGNAGTLQLNELLLTSAIQEVDGSSRMHEGSLLLNNEFEQVALDRAENYYSEGSIVQFEYIFDTESESFNNVEDGLVVSPPYKLGSDKADITYLKGRPLLSARMKVQEASDRSRLWTYQSTIGLDANDDYRIIDEQASPAMVDDYDAEVFGDIEEIEELDTE